MFDINGKVAIITGGTSGIGYSTAEALLKKGGKVVITGRGVERGAKAADDLKAISPDVEFYQADTSNEEEMKALVDYVVDKYGELNTIFNNAGIGVQATVDAISGDDWRKVIDINLSGVFYGVKYASMQMKKQGKGGVIISTSSIEGVIGDPILPAYCASKGGVNQLTKSAALALAKDGIRVNSVNPGYVETGLVNEKTMGKEAIDYLISLHPVGRLAQPEEIAHAVVFLIENEFVTGLSLVVDGGYTAQ